MRAHLLCRHRTGQPGGFSPARLHLRRRYAAVSNIWPLLTALVGMLALQGAGAPLASPTATSAACLAMLLFGLPHGTLDIELLAAEHRSGARRLAAVLLLYLGLAAGMYLLWQAAPIGALATFLVVASLHFAEDWEEAGSAFLSQGGAVSILTAPTLMHLSDVQSLFVALSGREDAAVLGDMMLLLAPVSLAVSAIALLSIAQAGRPDQAAGGAAALAGMALLPPAIGFSLFFCLYHSPRHFRAALSDLSVDQFHRRWRFVVPFTLAALGIAAWLFSGEVRATLPAQVVAASFMTLSILTVPHMAVPAILARGAAIRALLPIPSKEPPHADQGPSRIQA